MSKFGMYCMSDSDFTTYYNSISTTSLCSDNLVGTLDTNLVNFVEHYLSVIVKKHHNVYKAAVKYFNLDSVSTMVNHVELVISVLRVKLLEFLLENPDYIDNLFNYAKTTARLSIEKMLLTEVKTCSAEESTSTEFEMTIRSKGIALLIGLLRTLRNNIKEVIIDNIVCKTESTDPTFINNNVDTTVDYALTSAFDVYSNTISQILQTHGTKVDCVNMFNEATVFAEVIKSEITNSEDIDCEDVFKYLLRYVLIKLKLSK